MNIQEQKALADNILHSLSPHFNIVLAGGAPREWHFGRPANDLDFFIIGEDAKERVEELLNYTLEPLTDKHYKNSLFRGYRTFVGDQEVQFLFHSTVGSVEELVSQFPLSVCQIWYDGETHTTKWFDFGERYNAFIVVGNERPWAWVDKVISRFDWRWTYFGERDFLTRAFAHQASPTWPTNVALAVPMPQRAWADDPFDLDELDV